MLTRVLQHQLMVVLLFWRVKLLDSARDTSWPKLDGVFLEGKSAIAEIVLVTSNSAICHGARLLVLCSKCRIQLTYSVLFGVQFRK